MYINTNSVMVRIIIAPQRSNLVGAREMGGHKHCLYYMHDLYIKLISLLEI